MFCHEFILADLRVFDNCAKVCAGCDHVFNLAADMGGMGFIQSNHGVIFYNNTMISFNMLEAARKADIKRCVVRARDRAGRCSPHSFLRRAGACLRCARAWRGASRPRGVPAPAAGLGASGGFASLAHPNPACGCAVSPSRAQLFLRLQRLHLPGARADDHRAVRRAEGV